jgi:putative peptidoglycan lipid II flippase
MLKSSGLMAMATLMSRILGMGREMVYASFMGDGWVASAFTMAFTIPNLFRRLLGEGALTAAFIPIFKEKEKRAGEVEMWRTANAVISGLVIATSAIIALVMLGLSLVLAVHQFEPQTELMLRLLWMMFPYLLLVCLTATFMGMLNARGYFFIPALGATMLNVVMIASVLWLAPHFGRSLPQQIFALAVGVLVAGVAQGAFQLPALWRDGFAYRWVSPFGDETVRLVVRRMIPGTLGLAAFQINVLLTQSISFGVDPHIVACSAFPSPPSCCPRWRGWRRRKTSPSSVARCARGCPRCSLPTSSPPFCWSCWRSPSSGCSLSGANSTGNRRNAPRWR